MVDGQTPGNHRDLEQLYRRLSELRMQVEEEGERRYRQWVPYLQRPAFDPSARNLADYLVLRKHDLRPLQRDLAMLGLSSLGRAESRVRENLDAVLATLGRVLGRGCVPYPTAEGFFAREALLEAAAQELFGPGEGTCILVTLPEAVASDARLARRLIQAGMDVARINCGHGSPEIWSQMIAQVRQAAQGRPIPILMDLSGPRLRTETVWADRRLLVGDQLALTTKPAPDDRYPFQATVGLPQALEGLRVGHRVFIDEGKLEARVVQVGDVECLLRELEARQPLRLRGVVLKIETAEAVSNLPDLMVRAAGRWPTAIMIARGDLAIELGYQRLAEMQEEILWLAEAASVPVIWATQVLDRLVRKGTPSRAEVSDAVLAARAECVMLNKGPYLEQGIQVLSDVLRRMQDHQYKKTPKMRPLKAWS